VTQPQVAGGPPTTLAQWGERAQLFEGLGDLQRAISTNLAAAQAHFDQGMRFLWAFNHDEATRSFAKAAELDPQCAMCYWGVALTVGAATGTRRSDRGKWVRSVANCLRGLPISA
jgi:hypothetical protein